MVSKEVLADVAPNDVILVSVDVVSKKEKKRRKKKSHATTTEERVARARARKRGRTHGGLQKQLPIVLAQYRLRARSTPRAWKDCGRGAGRRVSKKPRQGKTRFLSEGPRRRGARAFALAETGTYCCHRRDALVVD